MGKKRPLTRDDTIPMRDIAERQVLVVTYNRITDAVEVDGEGLSPLEVRGILSLAVDETTTAISEE